MGREHKEEEKSRLKTEERENEGEREEHPGPESRHYTVTSSIHKKKESRIYRKKRRLKNCETKCR